MPKNVGGDIDYEDTKNYDDDDKVEYENIFDSCDNLDSEF